MTFRSTHIGDDVAEVLAGIEAPPSGPPHGPTVITFPQDRCRLVGPAVEGGGEDLPPSFVMLGTATAAIIMRLSQRLPRIALAPTMGGDGRDEL